jgi:hypothetical protein
MERHLASYCSNGRLSGCVTESHFFVVGIICYSEQDVPFMLRAM